jgi:hypothetical protein
MVGGKRMEEIAMEATDVRAISYLRVPDEEEWPEEIRELGELF